MSGRNNLTKYAITTLKGAAFTAGHQQNPLFLAVFDDMQRMFNARAALSP
ncbi:hypothetical protein MT962_001618 [Franconibacter sp. IITDAS19]|nr:hypothetical protein [Franconibacter sp. IITDAS19]MCK1967804.1 hypothetical protein [Franconibacter sp. IITDAS19]